MPIPTYLDQDSCDSLASWIDTSGGQVTANSADGIYYDSPYSFKIDPDASSGGWIQKMVDDPFVDDGVIYSLEYWLYFPTGWAASASTGLQVSLPGFSSTAAGGNVFQTDLYVSKVGSDIVINEGDLDLVVPEALWIHCFIHWTNDGGTTSVHYGAGYAGSASSDAAWNTVSESTPGFDRIGPGMPLFTADDLPVFYVDLIRVSKVDLESAGGCSLGEWSDSFATTASTADWEYDPGNDTGAPSVSSGYFTAEYGNGSGGWGVRRGYLTGGIYKEVWHTYKIYLPTGFWSRLWTGSSLHKYVVAPGFEILGSWNGQSIGDQFANSIAATSVSGGQIIPYGADLSTPTDLDEGVWYTIIEGLQITGATSDFYEMYLDGVLVGQTEPGAGLLGTATGGIFGACWSYDQGYDNSPGLELRVDDWHWSPCSSLRPSAAATMIPIVMSY